MMKYDRRAVMAGGAALGAMQMVSGFDMMANAGPMETRVTDTPLGKVRGTRTPSGFVYRGLPYAAAPVGHLRFRPPVLPRAWAGIRDATQLPAVCPQSTASVKSNTGYMHELAELFVPWRRKMDEDCLTVDVWTPASDGRKRPVMVWIHGGGFSSGCGSDPLYDGVGFNRDDVVLVTVTYRLHAFGFLYLDGLFEGASGTGNCGIYDQIAALRWVQQNISAFGGNPANVTVFGQSAGGAAVGNIMATPAARGAYHRAILQSGVFANKLPEEARTATARFLQEINVRPGDWATLEAVPTDVIVRKATELPMLLAGVGMAGSFPFSPVMDGVARDKQPIEMVAAGSAAGVDAVIGTDQDEARLFVFGGNSTINGNFPRPDLIKLLGPQRGQALQDYYAGRGLVDARDIMAAVQTDQMFTGPGIRLADALSARAEGAVYRYRFDWSSPVNGGNLGAFHTIEVPFVFDRLDCATLVGNSPPVNLARQVHGAWCRFARTGDPNGKGLPQWPHYDRATRQAMLFDTASQARADPDAIVRRAWAEPSAGTGTAIPGDRAR